MKPMSTRETPSNYQQPVDDFSGRNVNDTLEMVSYIPDAHMRIWYNNTLDNYSLHHHGAMEIIICEENDYLVVANGKKYLLNVGDILMIPPHMLHEIICEKEGSRFIILLNIEHLSNLHDYKTLNPIFMDPYLCNAKTRPNIYQQVYALCKQIIEAYFSNDMFWETTVYSLFLRTMVIIGNDYFSINHEDENAPSADKQKEHYEKFASLLNFIDANYTEELTLEQAADIVGFSKFHFSRLFKQYTNTTFYDYLCHKRVQAAQSLLTMDIPITDIAFQTGFNNLTTFCRCFKKCTNCSPTEYRNKFRQEQVP